MTPEQLVAVHAGQGVAHLADPASGRVYLLVELVEQGQQPALAEDYFREKLREGIAESEQGESQAWNVGNLKDDLRRRRTAKQSKA